MTPSPSSQAKNQYRVIPFEKLKSSKAWKVTSLLVRMLSGGVCYTCGKKYPIEKLVAGHFREKRGNAGTYFDLDNLRAQCGWFCNRQKHGMKDEYARKLVKELGPEILNELFKRSNKPKQWTKKELEEIYEERVRLLEKARK